MIFVSLWKSICRKDQVGTVKHRHLSSIGCYANCAVSVVMSTRSLAVATTAFFTLTTGIHTKINQERDLFTIFAVSRIYVVSVWGTMRLRCHGNRSKSKKVVLKELFGILGSMGVTYRQYFLGVSEYIIRYRGIYNVTPFCFQVGWSFGKRRRAWRHCCFGSVFTWNRKMIWEKLEYRQRSIDVSRYNYAICSTVRTLMTIQFFWKKCKYCSRLRKLLRNLNVWGI